MKNVKSFCIDTRKVHDAMMKQELSPHSNRIDFGKNSFVRND